METKRGETSSSSINSNTNSSNTNFLIKQNYLRKLKVFLNEKSLEEKDVYNLIRNFFKEFLEINYEFTNEELKQEIKHIYFDNELKEKISDLFDELSEIEYFSKSLSQDKLVQLLQDFKLILSQIKTRGTIIKPKSFLIQIRQSLKETILSHKDLIFNKKTNNNQDNIYNIVDNEANTSNVPNSNFIKIENSQINLIRTNPKLQELKAQQKLQELKEHQEPKKAQAIKIPKKISDESKIKQNISKINKSSKKDFNKAKSLYLQTLKIYNNLDDNTKDLYFQEIQNAYLKLTKLKGK